MRIAILDLGSNTFNLKVFEDTNDQIIFNDKIPVKLLKGNANNDSITTEAKDRAIEALKVHKKTISNLGVEKGFAFATSAIRSTKNGGELVDQIYSELGIKVHVIDGQQEAQFIFEGVKKAVSVESGLIVDIGGGSTELVYIDNYNFSWGESYLLGVGRILEKFNFSNPAKAEQFENLKNHLDEQWGSLPQSLNHSTINTLIGSSGSFDTLYDLVASKNNTPLLSEEQVRGEILVEDILHFEKLLKFMTTEERLNVPGMLEMRAEMMHISVFLMAYLIRKFSVKKVLLSTYALKEGVIEEIKNKQSKWQPSF